jgi:prolyl oligopeptidase
MKKLLLMGSIALLFSCKSNEVKKISMLPYPETKKVDTVDNYFGTTIADPYRWLENDTTAETAAWVEAQNKVTQHYLAQIPFREQIKNSLTEIWNYEKVSAPYRKGEYYYYSKNDGLQNQSVIYYKKGLEAEEKVFLDPNKLSDDGTVSLGGLYFSNDYKYAAYTISRSGSDWNEIYVIDIEKGSLTKDVIKWVKFSGAAWRGNGFYYSRYDEPKGVSELSNQNQFQKVYYHTLGEDQAKDKLIFEDKNHPLRYFGADVSEDERYLYIYASEGTSGSEILIQDLKNPNGKIEVLLPGFEFNYSIVDNIDNNVLVLMDNGASNYRVVSIDPKNKSKENWKTIIDEQKELLEGVKVVGNKIYANYLKDASSTVVEYSIDGQSKKNIELPGIGTLAFAPASKKDSFMFYSFSNFTTPGTIYKLDIATGKSSLYIKPNFKINTDNFETKQVWFTSKDGTKIPMFVVHKKGIKLDGTNPTLLYGYGGFNISLTPAFSVSNMYFMEQGGIYAQVTLRGGGEYGEEWHKAGMLEKKQNVFDDFISAAEYLISEKYTSSERLAISGRSNGGLLVGACMTQRPDLFKVALPGVGVLDMLRYHKFTIGWGWAVEYGASNQQDQFNYLLKYSPLHNVKDSVSYPATLITTADHDDRVVPAHSFKFAATLQEKHKGENPILIRIDSKAGHGAGKPTSKIIEEVADIWSFVFWNFNYNIPKNGN